MQKIMESERMQLAFAGFDEYNKRDPKVITTEGEGTVPEEYFFALQLYNWVKKLEPQASEALLLASRCQHIGRWESPRESYPEGKAGYLNWRSNLAKYHAYVAAGIMGEAGYNEPEIEEVQRILLKKQLKTDPEVQVMENALCLVFLEFQFEDFSEKHDEAKIIRILQKTWGKMTGPGREAALSLNYSEKAMSLLKKALGA